MNTSANSTQKQLSLFWRIHEKVSSWSAHLIGPVVFNFGLKEEAWNMSTADLLQFPDGTVGNALGAFLKKNRLEPIAGAESHDLFHVLFDYSTTFKGEVLLQFFLRGNGKRSIASFGTSLGAWFIYPGQWHLLKAAYARGKSCSDISRIDLKKILNENIEKTKISLIPGYKTQSTL